VEFWPIFFPSVVPVAYLLYLAWCVIRQTPEVDEAPPGPDEHDPRRWHRDPRRPRDPRRGPHAPDHRHLGRRATAVNVR
jgi:threonine/homoserine/homoserine lactone efflux protein